MSGLILAGHLLCMNLAAAGPLAAILLDESHRRGNPLAADASRKIVEWSLYGMIVGAIFGLFLGWVHWNAHYAALWTERLGWKAAWGVAEFAVSLLVTGIVVAIPPSAERPPSRWGWRTWAMLFSATNLVYHFPALMSIAAQQAASDSNSVLRGKQFLGLMSEPAILARIAHFVLAAIASTGVCILGFALRYERQKGDAKNVREIRHLGGWLALLPTLAQMGVGVWLFTTLDAGEQPLLLGNDLLATGALLGSILLALAMIQDLAQLLFGDDRRILSIRVMIYFVLIVVLMSLSLDRLHLAARKSRVAELTTKHATPVVRSQAAAPPLRSRSL